VRYGDLENVSTNHGERAAIGFGCAGLFGLVRKQDRRAMLEAAYDVGIRHFDVAPIYGLGIAEAELGEFLSRHDEVTVGTKFGLDVTGFGRLAGATQAPIRRVLNRAPALNRAAKKSGHKPSAGRAAKLLYSERDYSVANAQRSLTASLRAMKRDRLDYFFLHEPAGASHERFDDIADYLDDECRKGTIRWWGPAGDFPEGGRGSAGLIDRASALQCRYDFINGFAGPLPNGDRQMLTFGFLSGALEHVRAIFGAAPQLQRQCADLVGADWNDRDTLAGLLVRDAVGRPDVGVVLYSTTNRGHLESIFGDMERATPGDAELMAAVRHRINETETGK